MKKKLLPFLFLCVSAAHSQVTIFEDSFESYTDFEINNFGNWNGLDLDLLFTYTGGNDTPAWANAGEAQAFQIFNPVAASVTNAVNGVGGETENRNFDPKTGSKYAACWAGVPSSNGQTATANNDWLISPPIDLTNATGSSLSFWVKSLSDSYGFERYRIGVYIGNGTPTSESDFTIISGVLYLSANTWTTWAERTQSLSAYDGQIIRIGIKCETSDAYMLMVDDFKVTAAALNAESFKGSSINVYPNPADNILNINSDLSMLVQSISIIDMNGRTIKQIEVNQTNLQINISDLNTGVYILEIQSEKGKTIKKFTKI